MSVKYNQIVVKIGSSTIIDKSTNKIDINNLQRIVSQVAELVEQGRKVIIVTSGSIATGTEKLKLRTRPRTIPEKQAAAAVGQSILMRQYEKAFEKFNIIVAQILLTRDAIADRERYLNARHTISTLLEEGVVPVVNENDTVAVDEIKVGDNDTLAALVSSLMGVDLLIMLTDVDGFYMDSEEGVSYKVDKIEEITSEVEDAASHSSTQLGTGGMITKIQAAKICQDAGVTMIITHGRESDIISIAAGKNIGTVFVSKAGKMESRKRWLAHGLTVKGYLEIDAGAESAIIKKGSSLLPAGITNVDGKFKIGDAIEIRDTSGKVIARGLTNYSKGDIERIKGKKSSQISQILGFEGTPEVIHRDNLVLL
jgi:glutamate 5-kinase